MDSQSTKPRRVTAAEARSLLEEHGRTELSVAAFAREKGIHPWPLYNARAQARQRAKTKDEDVFAPVTLVERPPTSPSESPPIELALPSGLTVRIGAAFDEVTLRRLLGVLATC